MRVLNGLYKIVRYFSRVFVPKKLSPKFERPSVVIYNPDSDLYIPFLVKIASEKNGGWVYDGYLLRKVKTNLRGLDETLVCNLFLSEIPEEKLLDPKSLEKLVSASA